jgi:hypothetical protein
MVSFGLYLEEDVKSRVDFALALLAAILVLLFLNFVVPYTPLGHRSGEVDIRCECGRVNKRKVK